MSDLNRYSRIHKFEKRRKNKRAILILMIMGSCLAILLIILIFITGKDEPIDQHADQNNHGFQTNAMDDETDINNEEHLNNVQFKNNQENENIDKDKFHHESSIDQGNNNHNLNSPNDEVAEILTESIESTDENVIEAYTGNWEPVGTIQEGPHTTNYNNGSQDRMEIDLAVRLATGLSEDNMETWWVGNGGDQKVIATVSDRGENEIYRVYLTWIDHEGWQPTKVERLKENDKK